MIKYEYDEWDKLLSIETVEEYAYNWYLLKGNCNIMKDNKIKINPLHVAIGSIIITWLPAIWSDFGRTKVSGPYSSYGAMGVVLIAEILILPLFFKNYRNDVWTKKGIITLVISFFINLPVAVICIINQFQ